MSIYQNDDSSRSFFALDVGAGFKQVEAIMECIDIVGEKYKLPPFYKPPKFHASIGWQLGSTLTYSDQDLQSLMSRPLIANSISCKIANITHEWRIG